jgi:hypothetical protein
MTVEEWIDQTEACTLVFSHTPLGQQLRDECAAANPSWKHLSEYGRKLALCAFVNPRITHA